jgi:alpha/beta superfamily hydrolase
MSATSTSRLIPVTIEGPAGALEGLLQEHDGVAPSLTALVCHPHPLHGGTLHNKVVHRVASTLHGLGAAVLRFNFRGAGKSEGVHDEGVGELEDARAALAFLRARHSGARRWIAGFSFGSWVAARLTASKPDTKRVILISPPIRRSSFEVLRHSRVPKLVVQGTADTVCPLELLEREFSSWMEPRTLVRVEGATHFYDRQLGALGDALLQALSEAAKTTTS